MPQRLLELALDGESAARRRQCTCTIWYRAATARRHQLPPSTWLLFSLLTLGRDALDAQPAYVRLLYLELLDWASAHLRPRWSAERVEDDDSDDEMAHGRRGVAGPAGASRGGGHAAGGARCLERPEHVLALRRLVDGAAESGE